MNDYEIYDVNEAAYLLMHGFELHLRHRNTKVYLKALECIFRLN